MNLNALWGTFQTLEVVKTFLKFSFKDHPAVSSQYVKFLVTSKGGDLKKMVAQVTELLKEISSKIETALKTSKEAKASAASAQNSVDQMKRNKKNKKDGEE